MEYDGSELFWKNLYTKEDMMKHIVWEATTDDKFNEKTSLECYKICKALGLKDSTKSVLDFGCGIGRLAKYIASHTSCRVAGVDVSQPMINQARLYCEGTGVEFVHMLNGFTIPAPNDCVDAVYSHIVLQHIHKYKVYFIFKEFYRVLTSGGLGFIQLPNFKKCLPEYDMYASDYVNYDSCQISAMNFWFPEEAGMLLERVGFKIISVEEEGTDFYVLFRKP